jgi:hypothetical protein
MQLYTFIYYYLYLKSSNIAHAYRGNRFKYYDVQNYLLPTYDYSITWYKNCTPTPKWISTKTNESIARVRQHRYALNLRQCVSAFFKFAPKLIVLSIIHSRFNSRVFVELNEKLTRTIPFQIRSGVISLTHWHNSTFDPTVLTWNEQLNNNNNNWKTLKIIL